MPQWFDSYSVIFPLLSSDFFSVSMPQWFDSYAVEAEIRLRKGLSLNATMVRFIFS